MGRHVGRRYRKCYNWVFSRIEVLYNFGSQLLKGLLYNLRDINEKEGIEIFIALRNV